MCFIAVCLLKTPRSSRADLNRVTAAGEGSTPDAWAIDAPIYQDVIEARFPTSAQAQIPSKGAGRGVPGPGAGPVDWPRRRSRWAASRRRAAALMARHPAGNQEHAAAVIAVDCAPTGGNQQQRLASLVDLSHAHRVEAESVSRGAAGVGAQKRAGAPLVQVGAPAALRRAAVLPGTDDQVGAP